MLRGGADGTVGIFRWTVQSNGGDWRRGKFAIFSCWTLFVSRMSFRWGITFSLCPFATGMGYVQY